ncbi:MAG TPA: TraY domain-containing protein [Thermoanaerobaculia bacterium]|nr:TraY domain-containing protein [Thermoanaerobaculia bacterium]
MADLSIKNLPEQLYRRLKQSAKRNRRSLNKEVAYRIELGLQTPPERSPAEVREIIKGARKLRLKMKAEGNWATDDEIRAAKNQGRP